MMCHSSSKRCRTVRVRASVWRVLRASSPRPTVRPPAPNARPADLATKLISSNAVFVKRALSRSVTSNLQGRCTFRIFKNVRFFRISFPVFPRLKGSLIVGFSVGALVGASVGACASVCDQMADFAPQLSPKTRQADRLSVANVSREPRRAQKIIYVKHPLRHVNFSRPLSKSLT